MKNISRRVFIKGLAVAGVAAAASTVLAGCNTNMIPGVDDGADDQPETPAASNSLTLTSKADSSKTFSMEFADIEAGSVAFGNQTVGSIRVNLSNDLGKAVYLAPTATTALKPDDPKVAEGDYVIYVEAYQNGLPGNTVDLYTDAAASATKLADLKVEAGGSSVRLYVANVTAIKNSLTVKVTLKKALNIDSSNATAHAFEEMDSKTYTFNL